MNTITFAQGAPTILLVDDDASFTAALGMALRKRGYEVQIANSPADALTQAEIFAPERVLLDLRMQGVSGLTLISQLLAIDPYTAIVVLTGYAGVHTAVEAIKLGAVHYLAKPVEVEEIIAAFGRREGDPTVPIEHESEPQNVPLSAVEWQHIQSVLARHQGNISASARELNMHRRTLQRKLQKHPSYG